ncbi:type II secretion system F family protein [Patescibacteria group bacterium]
MAQFFYKAKGIDGKKTKDTIIAISESDARQKLEEQGLSIDELTPQKEGNTSFIQKLNNIFGGVRLVEKLFFTQHLYIMIKTGFSISKALSTLSLQTNNKKFKNIIEQLRVDVESGKSLSKAMSAHKKVFPEMFINMIAAGESSGKLDEVLKRLSVQMKKDHSMISKVKSALTYPVIVLIAMVAVGVVTMVFVVPQLTAVFSESAVELPLPTKILIATSDFLTKQWYIALSAVAIVIFSLYRLLKTKKGIEIKDKILLRMPIFSPVVKKINLARFSRTLSSLLETDIPIVQSFNIIASTLGNTEYKVACTEIAEKIKTGVSVSKTLQNYPMLFPPVTRQMVSIGEESGTLDTISGEIATFYEEEVDLTMASLSSLIEPIIMLLLGVGVAGMAVSIILPIYQLSEAL